MLWTLFWIAAYLMMIGVTRAVYEIATPNPPRYSSGERTDFERAVLPLFWPIGLPIIAGGLFGQYARKCIDEMNREDERHDRPQRLPRVDMQRVRRQSWSMA